MCALASMYANSMCRRALFYLLIAVALLLGDSDLLIEGMVLSDSWL